jgi:hypothetical protein
MLSNIKILFKKASGDHGYQVDGKTHRNSAVVSSVLDRTELQVLLFILNFYFNFTKSEETIVAIHI